MVSLDDVFGKEEKKPEAGIEIAEEIAVFCDKCSIQVDSALYDKAKKKLSTKCQNGHELTLETDLSWLIS